MGNPKNLAFLVQHFAHQPVNCYTSLSATRGDYYDSSELPCGIGEMLVQLLDGVVLMLVRLHRIAALESVNDARILVCPLTSNRRCLGDVLMPLIRSESLSEK